MDCQYRDKEVLPCKYYIKDQYCSLPHQFLCLEARKRKAPRISHSEEQTYCQCYYKWWLAYAKGIERINPPIRLLAGKIMSECLDQILASKPQSTYQKVLSKYQAEDDEEKNRELLMISAWCGAISAMPIAEEKGSCQYEFKWQDIEYPIIHGFLDWMRLDGDGKPSYAKEFKYSTNEGWSKFQVYNQLSTYFIPFPELQRIELVVLKVPTLKWIRKGKNEESAEEFEEKIFKDITHNKMSYLFKTNFWRSEFDLDKVKERYRVVCKEMYDRMEKGESAFWQTDNRGVCFGCDYLQICENDGIMSDQLYKKKITGACQYKYHKIPKRKQERELGKNQ